MKLYRKITLSISNNFIWELIDYVKVRKNSKYYFLYCRLRKEINSCRDYSKYNNNRYNSYINIEEALFL